MNDGWRAVRLGLRGLRREWRAGELHALLLALLVAVASVTAVGFFTDRMQRALLSGASDLLGADLLVLGHDPPPAELEAEARRLGLASTRTLTLRTALVNGERFELASMKAVSEGYPLRGRLRVADAPFADDRETSDIPAPGTAWLDPRLASTLGLLPGDMLEVGAARLRVARILSHEPDRGGDLFNIAPRVMINMADVPATTLVQPGSRVRYRLLVAGAEASLARFRAFARARLDTSSAVQGIEDARPELRAALDRARRFLGLAALVSVLLAGAAVAVAARRYASRHLDAAAVMRCLGASQRMVITSHATQLLVVGLAGSLAGCALGYAAQMLLAAVMDGVLRVQLPPPSLLAIPTGLATGLVTLAGFALPPLGQLGRVSPARVLRRDLEPPAPGALALYGAALLAMGALVWTQAGDIRLALIAIGGAIVTVLVLALAALLLVRALGVLRSRVGVAWRFGLANISRRAGGSVAQVMAFGLGIAMLLLLVVVRNDLLEAWRTNLPADTPNFFLVNIQPAEVEGVRAYLGEQGVTVGDLYPMVRGRLSAIDGREVKPDDWQDPRAQRLVTHDFNLSYSDTLPGHNSLEAGRFWTPSPADPAQVSVEQGLAARLGLELGSKLTFIVAGEPFSATVTSLRSVEWDSFQVNFFVLAPPALLAGRPSSWVTSFHLDEDRREALVELVRRFPSVTVIDVDALLLKVRQIVEHATLGVEYVFAFTLLAGFAVLFAAVQATLDERRYEAAILRTLGADRRRLLAGLVAEFAIIGALAGLLAASAAGGLGMLVAQQVFELRVVPNPWLWPAGMLAGALGVALIGVAGTRHVLREPPLGTLRAA